MPESKNLIVLKRLNESEIVVPIIGSTPLIPHRWSEKARNMMRLKQSGAAQAKHDPKDPETEAQSSLYWLDDQRPGMPATAFKAAMVEGCRFYKEPSMTEAKRMLYVVGEGVEQLVPIEGEKTLREDLPRNATNVVDLRYRYAFFPWSAILTVRFIAQTITAESVIALLDAGGHSGVGDWRPGSPRSNTGTFGQFRVDDERMAEMEG